MVSRPAVSCHFRDDVVATGAVGPPGAYVRLVRKWLLAVCITLAAAVVSALFVLGRPGSVDGFGAQDDLDLAVDDDEDAPDFR